MNAGAVSPTILVTGARGFIGSAVAVSLARTGASVRAGTRRLSSSPAIANPAPCACDLNKPAEVRAAVAGTDLVVHAAYGDDAAMARQCRGLLDVMADAGVRNLIYLSSIAVYGDRTGRVDEAAPLSGALGAYAAAKVECERLVREWVANPAWAQRRAVILRPGIVYGTGSRFWVDKMAERIRLGAWGDFGPLGEGVAALLHVDDLVTLIETATDRLLSDARAELPRYAAVNLVGPETPSWNAYFRALAAALDSPPPPRMDPSAIAARQAIALGAKVWRRLGLPGGQAAALAPTPGEIALFSRQADYAIDAARSLLDYSPRVGLREGLARTRTDQTNA